ncbi:MAG: hypothetical protein KBT75_01585 [Oleispira antarctica]|nr:hypothetical protein [Oleispira antarctica]
MFELADDLQESAFISVLNTGAGAREVLNLFQNSEMHADLMVDNDEILSGDASRIEAAIGHLDMLIILSNLSNYDERELACKVAAISKKADVLTLVYNLVPFEFKDSGKKAGADLLKSSILKTDLYLAVTEHEQSEPLSVKAKNIKDVIDAVTNVVMIPGIICIDFSDLRAVICTGKLAVFGVGMSSDVLNALDEVLSCNDFNNINTSDVSGMFITLTAGLSLTLDDFTLLGELIDLKVPGDCIVVIGTVLEPSFDEIKQVSVVFTGPELY